MTEVQLCIFAIGCRFLLLSFLGQSRVWTCYYLFDWQETNYTPVVYAINLPDSGWQEVGILVKDVIKNECKVNRSICIKKENVNMHIMLDRGC